MTEMSKSMLMHLWVYLSKSMQAELVHNCNGQMCADAHRHIIIMVTKEMFLFVCFSHPGPLITAQLC